MNAGDIIFSYDDSIPSRLIRYFDKGKFSHCSILISDNKILEAQSFTKSRIVPFYFKNYEIIDLGLSESQRKRVQQLAFELENFNYDYMKVLSYFIRDVFCKKFKIVNSPKNFICSEIVEIILADIGVIPRDKNLRDLTPNELYRYLKSIQGR